MSEMTFEKMINQMTPAIYESLNRRYLCANGPTVAA